VFVVDLFVCNYPRESRMSQRPPGRAATCINYYAP